MHTAANAGAYQASVFGFGGVTIGDGVVRIAPVLPPTWTSMSFPLLVRGQRLDVTLDHDGHVVTARPDNTSSLLIVRGDGEPAELEPGGALRW